MNKFYIFLISFLILQSCTESKIDYLKENRLDLTSTTFEFPQKDFKIIGFGAYHGTFRKIDIIYNNKLIKIL